MVDHFGRAGQGNQLVDDAPITFQQFIESVHYDSFRADLTVEQASFLETFRHDDFPVEWDVEDILARILSRHPCNPDLLGFGVHEFYMLLKCRRGQFPFNMLGSNVSGMTPDDRDAFFVDFVKRTRQQGSVVATGHE